MPIFSGKYEYLDANGATLQEAACRLAFDDECLQLTPASGAPLACDLGDIDSFSPGDYELSLRLCSSKTIRLSHFGKAFQNLSCDLLKAFHKRLLHCLLLEDLEEIERFDGWAQLSSSGNTFLSRAEIRLYRSNLAILPETATGFSWRLADIDSIDFDEATYTLGLRSGECRLILTRLAKRTREFIERLQEAMTCVAETGGQTIRSLFPFLNPDQFQSVAGLFKEGRAVAVGQLNSIHPQIERALTERAVDTSLKVYHDHLKTLLPKGLYFTGYKEIRKEAEDEIPAPEETRPGAEEVSEAKPAVEDAAAGNQEENRILHWFFFPLTSGADPAVPANAVAWEATSRSGRATYFFKLFPDGETGVLRDAARAPEAIGAAVYELNRGIITLNFRREPIYLPDDALELEKRFRRYAIACRKIPALRRLRASFLGRALHTSPEAWQKQVRAILARA